MKCITVNIGVSFFRYMTTAELLPTYGIHYYKVKVSFVKLSAAPLKYLLHLFQNYRSSANQAILNFLLGNTLCKIAFFSRYAEIWLK